MNIDWNDDYSIGLIATDDPRVFGVLKRDEDAEAPDGDAFAPAFALDSGCYGDWTADTIGWTYSDSESEYIMGRILEARQRRVGGDYSVLERYARIFHDTTFELVSSRVHRDYSVLILNTPTWREHIGLVGYDESVLNGDTETWQAYLDGDVYGIGTYIDMARTDHDAPLPDHTDAYYGARDSDDGMAWGYYGEDYAAREAHDEATCTIDTIQPLLF